MLGYMTHERWRRESDDRRYYEERRQQAESRHGVCYTASLGCLEHSTLIQSMAWMKNNDVSRIFWPSSWREFFSYLLQIIYASIGLWVLKSTCSHFKFRVAFSVHRCWFIIHHHRRNRFGMALLSSKLKPIAIFFGSSLDHLSHYLTTKTPWNSALHPLLWRLPLWQPSAFRAPERLSRNPRHNFLHLWRLLFEKLQELVGSQNGRTERAFPRSSSCTLIWPSLIWAVCGNVLWRDGIRKGKKIWRRGCRELEEWLALADQCTTILLYTGSM